MSGNPYDHTQREAMLSKGTVWRSRSAVRGRAWSHLPVSSRAQDSSEEGILGVECSCTELDSLVGQSLPTVAAVGSWKVNFNLYTVASEDQERLSQHSFCIPSLSCQIG